MAWQKVSVEMVKILDEALLSSGAERRIMFGSPAYFVNNNMFAGAHQDAIILRLSEDDRVALTTQYDEVAPFEPMEGRPMREYVVVPEAVYEDPGLFGAWLAKGQAYAASLPPKERKPRRKKA